MNERDKDVRGLVAGFLALIVSALMWVGLVSVFRLALSRPEAAGQVVAGVFLLLGSYLVIRACVELDR